MNLIVGYQTQPDDRLVKAIVAHRDAVGEVYFAWPGIANGRNTVALREGMTEWEQLERQIADLEALSAAGLRFNLLLNGNCYGRASLSRAFYTKIGDLTDWIEARFGLASITTASPVIARFIRDNFPDIEVRASVNMEIGTREGVEYLADVMDGFYVKRELNRHITEVRAFADFCHRLGKKVYLLANSGCLNHCSCRTFHDNLVSHEAELMQMDNAFAFEGQCRTFLSKGDARRRLIQLSNWIMPRDLPRYEGVVDGFKLATRVSANPELIVYAYASGRFSGNLLQLTEPDFSGLYRPAILSADRMPGDFFEVTSACGRDCDACGYCLDAFDGALEALPDDVLI